MPVIANQGPRGASGGRAGPFLSGLLRPSPVPLPGRTGPVLPHRVL